MTKISKTSSIDALHNLDRVGSKQVNKKSKPSDGKASKTTLSELEKKIQLLIKNNEDDSQQLKESVIKEIIKWQFGESDFNKPQFKNAYANLLATLKDSESYQKILDDFSKKQINRY